jgi:hypothetical protein
MKVYAVGVIHADLSENPRRFIKDSRLWYLFADFQSAEKCVLENQSDIFEYYYNLALIEEIGVIPSQKSKDKGTWGYIPPQWWYRIVYNDDPDGAPTIEKIPTPKCMENVACFWVG